MEEVHNDNQKNNFLILNEGPTGTNDNSGAAEKKLVLTLVK